jgi:hypothetical protein
MCIRTPRGLSWNSAEPCSRPSRPPPTRLPTRTRTRTPRTPTATQTLIPSLGARIRPTIPGAVVASLHLADAMIRRHLAGAMLLHPQGMAPLRPQGAALLRLAAATTRHRVGVTIRLLADVTTPHRVGGSTHRPGPGCATIRRPRRRAAHRRLAETARCGARRPTHGGTAHANVRRPGDATTRASGRSARSGTAMDGTSTSGGGMRRWTGTGVARRGTDAQMSGIGIGTAMDGGRSGMGMGVEGTTGWTTRGRDRAGDRSRASAGTTARGVLIGGGKTWWKYERRRCEDK